MSAVRLHQLSNGVRVLCDPMPGLETFALSVVVRGGARWEPKNRSGWSHLLEHMVFKGAGGRSAREIVETVEDVGAQINAETGYERTSFQIRALKGQMPLTMAVLADLVLRPTIDADDLEREKAVVGQEIAEAYDAADDQVFEMAQAKAFSGTPLGRPILGSVKSIAAADPHALAAWRSHLYAPDRIAVSVAGAVDEDETLALVERLFGHESAAVGSTPAPEPTVFIGGSARHARAIEQANLVWALPGPGVHDPDWFAARLFAEILGGGMASRLFQEAREKRGLAYAIDAWAVSYEGVGQLGVYAGAAAKDAEALGRLVAEQVRALSEHVSPAELGRAKAQLKTSLLMFMESPQSRAERAATHAFLYGRVLSPEETRAGVDAVTAEGLTGAAQRMLAPKLAATAALGPRKALAAGAVFVETLFS